MQNSLLHEIYKLTCLQLLLISVPSLDIEMWSSWSLYYSDIKIPWTSFLLDKEIILKAVKSKLQITYNTISFCKPALQTWMAKVTKPIIGVNMTDLHWVRCFELSDAKQPNQRAAGERLNRRLARRGSAAGLPQESAKFLQCSLQTHLQWHHHHEDTIVYQGQQPCDQRQVGHRDQPFLSTQPTIHYNAKWHL